MKKIATAITIIILTSGFVWAGELEEAQLQMKNIKLEFQLFEARQQILKYQAKELQVKIAALKAKAKTTAKQPSRADEKGIELNPHEDE